MSGHSKWSTIKHKKAATDAKKANIFTKIGRLVAISAKDGGGNPDTNFKLKMAIDKARAVNMPKENIERAIKKGTGYLKDGEEIEEITYEAYGPGQVAMLIETATDNKNRTLGEIKNIITKAGGKMVSAGSVAYLFKKVGSIDISVSSKNLEEMELKAIGAGAEDTDYADDVLTIYTKADELQKIKEELEDGGAQVKNTSLVYIPFQKAKLDQENEDSYGRLLESLDEQDDVQEIHDNIA